jgi:gluconokinase
MIRSVLEGVMFRIHSVTNVLEELSGTTVEIRASGGFARSEFWSQMLADVTGIPVTIPDSIESSGLGAAKLALLAMEEIKDLRELDGWVQISRRHEVNQEAHEIYKELTPIYRSVYHQMKYEFDAISAFQHKHVNLKP